MLKDDAIIVRKCLRTKEYLPLYELSRRMDIRNELVKMFPAPFERVVKRAGIDGVVCEQIIVDPGKRSMEQVLEVLQANRRRLDFKGV